MSRLFRTHVPFGDSEVFSPRSPAPAVPASSSGGGLGIRHMFLSASPGTELDLDKCGTTSSSTVLLQEQQRALEAAATSDKSSVQQSLVLSPSSSDSASADNGLIMRDVSPAKSREDGVGAGSGVEKAVDDSSAVDAAPDCKALDRVADGIAGMSAAAVDLPAVKAVSVSEKEQSDPVLLEGDMTPETDVMRDSDTGNILVRDDEGVGQGKKMGLASSASVSVGGEGEGVRKSVDGGIAARADKALSDTGPDLKMEKNAQLLVSSAIPPVTPKVCRSEDATMMESSRLSGMKKKMLPRFYFPCGRDAEAREKKECEVLKEYFKLQRSKKKMHGVCRADIAELVVEVIGLPSYFAGIVFNAILKMFPSASSVEGKVNEQLRDHQLGQGGSGDVMKIEAATPNVKQNRSSLSTMENESGGTASDATMGDVNGVGNEERRVNGFHSSSQHQEASSNVEVHNASDMSGGSALYNSGNSKQVISEEQFVAYYNSLCAGRSKEERLFYALLEPGAKRNYLVANDFKPLLQALLMCHQGLTFLHVTPEFQQRYSETVIERIYFGCTRQHNGRLTIQDIKNSKLLDTLMVVDEEEDINRERKYFSYEHFYVLYCRFWELDGNHDLQIDKEDLLRYGSHSLTARIVERVFRGYARPLDTPENSGFMSYTDFIWFCLSEEDKTSDTAIDYWFRCVDLDGDGLITMYDMEFFYKEQLHRMDTFGHEPVQIRDILCQLLDMINPNVDPPVIRRGDLKRCKLAGNFFNVLFNLNKFFAIEARDPLQIRQEHATPELTDWDRFAALEYLRLSAEEEGEEDESWEDVGEAGNPLMAGEAPF